MTAPPPTQFEVGCAPGASSTARGAVDLELAIGRGERLTTTPAGVNLGPLDLIADGAGRAFVLEMKAGRFHGFVVRTGETVHGYVDRCPHMGLPLAQTLDDYVQGGRIVCSWHGAIFAVEDGRCLGGPCPGAALASWPVAVRDGTIVTV